MSELVVGTSFIGGDIQETAAVVPPTENVVVYGYDPPGDGGAFIARLNVQVAPAANDELQVLLLTTSGAPGNVTGIALPLPLLRVIGTEELLPPKAKRPKKIGDGESEITDPLPLSETDSLAGRLARESVPISMV